MAPTEEDVAWFKSTFHPIPRAALPDDCIEYTIYALSPSLDANNESETRLRLKEVQKCASDLQKKWLRDYIWQRQAFGLEIQKDDGEVRGSQVQGVNETSNTWPGLSFLRGRTEYGDSIEDEWVVVWLLRQISTNFSDVWIKVTDNDGEFLLIEASGSLPAWLEPDVAENRVWINNGQLKIIKPASDARSAKRTEEKISASDARGIILEEPKRLMHSSLMEEEAFYRLRNYPSQIKANMHHAIAKVPRTVAFLLKSSPAYIAPAVEAFYLRDPIALKRLNAESESSSLPILPTDLVNVSVRFPKVAYAQLKSQDFSAPPALQSMTAKSTDLAESAAAETGMKVTCGFEMLLTDSTHQDKGPVREMQLLLEDLESGEETLPSDEDIAKWDKKQDDEQWLDIDFNDLEQELAGKAKAESGKKREFGDKSAHENLQRIVKQFEDFMNDEKAGVDGAGMFDDDDDLDDDDDNDDDEIDSDDEDKNASFGEDEFSKLMQEMMGMPPEVMSELMKGKLGPEAAMSEAGRLAKERSQPTDADATGADSDEEFEAHMKQIEAELRNGGALSLSEPPGQARAVKDGDGSDLSDDDLDDNDIDANLVKNLLESFKAQAGGAGPSGNLMGLMGAAMARDDREAGPSGSKSKR